MVRNRISAVICLALSCAALTAVSQSGILAAPPRDAATGLTLKETLEKGLRARRPQEFRFVARVALMVEQGDLPERTVKNTFQWARKKPKHPFQYFERALIIQARKQGVVVEPAS